MHRITITLDNLSTTATAQTPEARDFLSSLCVKLLRDRSIAAGFHFADEKAPAAPAQLELDDAALAPAPEKLPRSPRPTSPAKLAIVPGALRKHLTAEERRTRRAVAEHKRRGTGRGHTRPGAIWKGATFDALDALFDRGRHVLEPEFDSIFESYLCGENAEAIGAKLGKGKQAIVDRLKRAHDAMTAATTPPTDRAEA